MIGSFLGLTENLVIVLEFNSVVLAFWDMLTVRRDIRAAGAGESELELELEQEIRPGGVPGSDCREKAGVKGEEGEGSGVVEGGGVVVRAVSVGGQVG